MSLFVNYRNLTFEDTNRPKEPSLNSRLLYNDRFFNQLLQLSTAYETTSGTIPQQEFTYLEVEPGQGVYTWNDYNGNGIQELQEFEVAPFPDQAKYVRVFLPNQIFVKTHQNKFSQSVTLNPLQWQNETDFRKILSYFYNQTSFMMDRKILRQGDNFDLNPFSYSDENLLGLNATFRNSFFYNRGKQNHSVTYTYLTNHTRILLSAGSQESRNDSHQFQYAHLVQKLWLFGFHGKTILNTVTSENYPSKNFDLKGYQLGPKISYLFSQNASWDLFYEFQNKENTINAMEALNQQRFGTSFTYSSEKKFTANGEFSFYKNRFDGNQLSAVAFQMLEGLQAGENLTWRLLLQKNLTQYLDVNVNYQGRKSETSKAIHTGSIQLRAYF
ncbi:TonB-dependent receptor [Flavobacterium saliperosum]